MNPLRAIASLPGKVVGGVSRKVWGGTVGAGFGVPVAHVAMFFITDPKYLGVEFPPEVAQSASMLIEMSVTAVVALASGYMTTERPIGGAS
jgi:hypothetical protein